MKKRKKIILITIILLIVLGVIASSVFFYLKNPNRLNSSEKVFLADNSNNIQNLSVVNDVSIFGSDGKGVFYDFINDFSNEYGITINTVAYNNGEEISSNAFLSGNGLGENEFSLFKDHYVLISKNYQYIKSIKDLEDQKIGILSSNLEYVKSFIDENSNIIFSSYENDDKLFSALNKEDIKYIAVPMHLYLNKILSEDYKISYHLSDINYYFKFNKGNNSTLSSIIQKYFNKWEEDNLNKYYQKHLFNLFTTALKISSTEIDTMQSIVYNYGFVENSPYEILIRGNFGGIIAQYLKEFSEFSGVDFKFIKYKKYSQFNKAIEDNKVDLYFAYYNIPNSYKTINSSINATYDIIANKKNDLVLNSLKTLEKEEIYVEKNSNIYNYLINNTKLNIKTYKNFKEINKLVKKNKIIIIDSNVYENNKQSLFSKYNSRYKLELSSDYFFKANTNDTFIKLFKSFVNYKDPVETVYKGIYNNDKTYQNGTLVGTLARYFMYILIIFIIVFLYTYKIAKKIKISKKIKKADKLKYIDQLTSLKNRNYLNENLEGWSKNTIYPQTIIVIDLNNLQYINDTMGYEQGDAQIKAVSNILVKTQLDNSDIMRSDGNEFVIYLVGYQTKQIISYIHKLTKEFKKLPYEYGAAIGYSMINDDMKTIEDAINEAVEDVKNQKNNKKEEK